MASLLGDTFRFGDLQAASGYGETTLDKALDESCQARLVRPVDAERYAFNHALTRHVLYLGLSPRRRRRLHLSVGRVIEREGPEAREARAAELAHHFLRGGDRGRAVRYSVLAGDEAQALAAHADAERHYRAALGLAREAGDLRLEADVQAKLGAALGSSDRFDEAVQALGATVSAYRTLGDARSLTHTAARAGLQYASHGRAAEGIAFTERFLAELPDDAPSDGAAALHAALACLCLVSGRYREQLRAAERAAALARRAGDDGLLATAESYRGTALAVLGRWEEAVAALEPVVPLAEGRGDVANAHRALSALSEIHRWSGRFQLYAENRERSLEASLRMGSPARIAFAKSVLGRTRFFQGAWDEAESLLQDALGMTGSSRSWFSPYPLAHLGELRVAQGRYDEGSDLLERAAAGAERGRDMQALRMCHRALAEVELARGAPESAIRRLKPLVEGPAREELHASELLPTLAAACDAAGDAAFARDTVEGAVRRGREIGARFVLAWALVARGCMARDDGKWQAAEADLSEASDLARAMPYPHLLAHALLERGRLESARGRPEPARACLRESLGIARRLGARPLADAVTRAAGDLPDRAM